MGDAGDVAKTAIGGLSAQPALLAVCVVVCLMHVGTLWLLSQIAGRGSETQRMLIEACLKGG